MSSNFRIRRRQLLLGAAAGLAQTATPSKLSAQTAPTTPHRLLKAPKTHAIPKDVTNPFFRPQGKPLTGPRQRPGKAYEGEGLTRRESPIGRQGALESESPAVEAIASSGEAEATIQTAAFTIPALAIDDTPIETVQSIASPSTLVLYDTTNTWGWMGELYSMMAGNLASHFGPWTALPVASYTAGKMATYKAVIYIGSTYDEPLPAAFLTDVPKYQSVNVIWIDSNIWKLAPTLTSIYGWTPHIYETPTPTTVVASVEYKTSVLRRYEENGGGIMTYSSTAGATVLANCVRKNGTKFPWALRSKNLTYIGENPFVYITEGDRYLAFCDLLFDALAPTRPTRYRALLRLEDLDASSDPVKLRQIAAWLKSQNVPFGYHIVPRYRDPKGFYNNGVPQDLRLSATNQKPFRDALVYMQQNGGAPILHGYTHQYVPASNILTSPLTLNPETGVTADDCEFYRLSWNGTALNYEGPLPEDKADHAANRESRRTWVAKRMRVAMQEIALDSRLATPTVFTTPHYLGTATTSVSSSLMFAARAERVLYFYGTYAAKAAGGFDYRKIDYTRLAGQYFPYSVKDVYGGMVLPDTLGSIELIAYLGYAQRLPADIIADAVRLKAVRDSVAAFSYHSHLDIAYLQEVVNGLKANGYTFVSPTSVAAEVIG